MAKDCHRQPIDYKVAAERLLTTLAFIATKRPGEPTSAIMLCAHVFDWDQRHHWQRETKRRLIRALVAVARQLLKDLGQHYMQIAADGRGYWVTADPQVISWYAEQRRQRGLRELAAGSNVADAATHQGQKSLFPEPPKPLRH